MRKAGIFGVFGVALALLSANGWGQAYSDLHDFGATTTNANGKSGPDGETPEVAVTFDSSGNMYGTTYYGGPYNTVQTMGYGTVWEITAAGAYKDLHDFGGTITTSIGTSGPDGENPQATVTVDSEGNLFGTAMGGGAYMDDGGGIVWEITKAGVYKDIHDFAGNATEANGTTGPDGYDPGAGVAFDASGNLFGTAAMGGGNFQGTIWEITKAGTYKDIHDFGGTVINANGKSGPDGKYPIANLTFDTAGNLFGTANLGGANGGSVGDGMVFEMTTGGAYKDLHDFGGTIANANGQSGPDGIYPTTPVVFDTSGDMFGTANEGGPIDTGIGPSGMVWEIRGGVYKDLHDFGGTVTNADGTSGQDGIFPNAIAIDSKNVLWGTTYVGGPNEENNGYGNVWQISPAGVYKDVHDFGDTVKNADEDSGPDGQRPLSGVSFDAAGSAYGTTTQGGPYDLDNGGGGMVWKLATGVSLKSVSITPNPEIGGNTAIGSVTLTAAAPAGGIQITLSSSVSGVKVPASVTVAAGATSATFNVTTIVYPKDYSATITATGGGVSSSIVLTVYGDSVTGLSFSPTDPLAGKSATGTVTLSAAAPPTGWKVTLTSSVPTYVGVPASVVVAAGASSATFTATTKSYGGDYDATVTASDGTSSKSAALDVLGDSIIGVVMNPASVSGGKSSIGTVTLHNAAPTGGWVVKLASNLTAFVGVPASVTVPAGSTSTTFTATTKTYGGNYSATITASDALSSKTGILGVTGDSVVSLSLNPTAVASGKSTVGTVTLHNAAPAGGWVVKLASSNASYVGVPASVTVGAGASSATFTVTTKVYGGDYSATLTASDALSSKTATVGVYGDSITGLTISPTSVVGGASSTGTVTLHNAAPPGGWIVKLSSSNAAGTVSASITIAAGASTGTFTVVTKAVTATTTVTVTVSDTGSSKSASVTIKL